MNSTLEFSVWCDLTLGIFFGLTFGLFTKNQMFQINSLYEKYFMFYCVFMFMFIFYTLFGIHIRYSYRQYSVKWCDHSELYYIIIGVKLALLTSVKSHYGIKQKYV